MTVSNAGRRKAIVRIALAVILIAGGIGAVSTFHALDWKVLGAALGTISLGLVAVALVVSTAQVYAQLARFLVLVPAKARSPLLELPDATAVGPLLNYATPLRAGDAYKLVRLAPDTSQQRFSILLAALLVERAADVGALLIMAAWASSAEVRAWLPTVAPSSVTPAKIALGMAVVAVALALLVWRVRGS